MRARIRERMVFVGRREYYRKAETDMTVAGDPHDPHRFDSMRISGKE